MRMFPLSFAIQSEFIFFGLPLPLANFPNKKIKKFKMGRKSKGQLSRQQNLGTRMPGIAPHHQLTPLVPAAVIPAATNSFHWHQNPVALSGATNTNRLDDRKLAGSEAELMELEDEESQHNNTRSPCEEIVNMMQRNLDQIESQSNQIWEYPWPRSSSAMHGQVQTDQGLICLVYEGAEVNSMLLTSSKS